MYVCGIAALAANQFETLAKVLSFPLRDRNDKDEPLVVSDVFRDRQGEEAMSEVRYRFARCFSCGLKVPLTWEQDNNLP